MNLREIREQFILKSGRYDLIEEDGRDNGANFFIQAGQRFIDKQGDFGTGQIASWIGSTKVGVEEYEVANCWSITSLYIRKGDCWETIERVHSLACDKCRLTTDSYYAVVPMNSFPKLQGAKAKDVDIPASMLSQSLGEKTVAFTTGMKIKIWPTPTQVQLLKAIGHFYSTPLLIDTDVSYWSEQYPETLLKAAMYELEVFYRNTEGANDWLEAVMIDLQRLEQTELFSSIQGNLVFGRDL